MNFHGLHSCRSRPQKVITFPLVLDGDIPVQQAHISTDQLEGEIRCVYTRAFTTIHGETSNNGCFDCTIQCRIRSGR